MAIEFEEFTDTSLIYKAPETRYLVLQRWDFDAAIEGARFGMVLLFLTPELLVYSEIDDDPLYGGGYAKRERVQKITNYLQYGSIHPLPDWLRAELHEQILSLKK